MRFNCRVCEFYFKYDGNDCICRNKDSEGEDNWYYKKAMNKTKFLDLTVVYNEDEKYESAFAVV